MTTDKKNIACPSCGKKGTWTKDNPYRPFCSSRCKLIDLGDWADEKTQGTWRAGRFARPA